MHTVTLKTLWPLHRVILLKNTGKESCFDKYCWPFSRLPCFNSPRPQFLSGSRVLSFAACENERERQKSSIFLPEVCQLLVRGKQTVPPNGYIWKEYTPTSKHPSLLTKTIWQRSLHIHLCCCKDNDVARRWAREPASGLFSTTSVWRG